MVEGFQVLEAYDALAPFYEEYSKKKITYLNAIDDLVIGYLRDGDSLLDIGAGDGRRLEKIRKSVALSKVTAVEPSSEMAKICKKISGITVHQGFAEDLDSFDLSRFDRITALWNVFGHIPSTAARKKALLNIVHVMNASSLFIVDVNNRHNAAAYGKWNVIKRSVVDRLNFKESRGDAEYDWKIGDQTFKSRGHLFTPEEIEGLFAACGLAVVKRISIDYGTGAISSSKYKGQLFYVLKISIPA